MPDLNDLDAVIGEILFRLSRLESGANLKNAAIDKGALTIKSAEGLRVGTPQDPTGSAFVYGVLKLIGVMNADGTINLDGLFNVLDGGAIVIGGPVPIRIYQGNIEGSPQAMIKFGDETSSLAIYATDSGGSPNLVLQAGGGILQLNNDGIFPVNLPTEAASSYLALNAVGKMVKATGGSGGPGGGGPGDGVFVWPFPLDQVTSEYGMRLNPVTGEYTLHAGIDFGIGPSNTTGTPIPAAGAGIVIESTYSSGYGNYVLIDHGIDPVYGDGTHNVATRYAHMYQPPAVGVNDFVTLGQTLGGIGSTGNSTGNHLHYETLVDGTAINPRDFHAAHGG